MALTVVGAIGWLDLLRLAGVLAVGPSVRGALPLQQLAGDDVQPVLRLAVAWIPAGAIGALALAAGTSLGRLGRGATIVLVAWVLLVLIGAASDAAAISESVTTHLPKQLARRHVGGGRAHGRGLAARATAVIRVASGRRQSAVPEREGSSGGAEKWLRARTPTVPS